VIKIGILDERLLRILACPKCKGDLKFKPSKGKKDDELICEKCNIFYPVVDGIPKLTPKKLTKKK
jgi:uncharacterized protein